MRDEKEKGVLGQISDIFFVMALCFVTLFASMLLNGPVIVGKGATGKMDYLKAITPQSVTIIVVILAVYLVYLLKNSNKELRIMINGLYGEKEETAADVKAKDSDTLSI